jgi:hypothetical protein
LGDLNGKDNLRDEDIDELCGSMCVNVQPGLGQSPVGVCALSYSMTGECL